MLKHTWNEYCTSDKSSEAFVSSERAEEVGALGGGGGGHRRPMARVALGGRRGERTERVEHEHVHALVVVASGHQHALPHDHQLCARRHRHSQ